MNIEIEKLVEDVARIVNPDAWAALERDWREDSRWLDEDHRDRICAERQGYASARARAILALPALQALSDERDGTPRWRCFHCAFETSDRQAATLHFGPHSGFIAACCMTATGERQSAIAWEQAASSLREQRDALLSGNGYVYFSPDAGLEYAPNHPVESGETPDAQIVRPSTAFEDFVVTRAQTAEAKLSALSERNGRLEGHLTTMLGYAAHDNDCDANLNEPCDCGYSVASREALALLSPVVGGGEEETVFAGVIDRPATDLGQTESREATAEAESPEAFVRRVQRLTHSGDEDYAVPTDPDDAQAALDALIAAAREINTAARASSLEQMIENEDGWSDWIHPLPGYRMGCCDCGLVHRMQFKIEPSNGDGLGFNPGESDAGVIVFRASREIPKTADLAHAEGWPEGGTPTSQHSANEHLPSPSPATDEGESPSPAQRSEPSNEGGA